MNRKLPPFSIIEILDGRIGNPLYRKGEKTRFNLMKAAAELLGDQPYNEIRNIDICHKANASAGMLNTYFSDKHDLIAQLLALFLECLEKEYEPHRIDLRDETDRYLRIHDRIEYIIEVSQRNPGVFRLLIVESPDFPNPEIVKLRSAAFHYWVNDLADLIPREKAGLKLSKKDRFTMAAMLGAMVDEAIRTTYVVRQQEKRHSTKRLVEMLAVLRYAAIYGEDPSASSRKKAQQNR